MNHSAQAVPSPMGSLLLAGAGGGALGLFGGDSILLPACPAVVLLEH